MDDFHKTPNGTEFPANPLAAGELRRRPIRARETHWAHAAARSLQRLGLRPNQISLLSIGFAACGALALLAAGKSARPWTQAACFVLAGGCMQLRLLCNLFDGLVAVEGGLRTKSGEIYNELPDRLSDILFLAAAGFATHFYGREHDLGWAAAVLAVLVAYVRVLGTQAGASPQFGGPMAKQQRMFLLTLACALSAGEVLAGGPERAMPWALGLIALGAAYTAARRTLRIVRELEAK